MQRVVNAESIEIFDRKWWSRNWRKSGEKMFVENRRLDISLEKFEGNVEERIQKLDKGEKYVGRKKCEGDACNMEDE